MPIVRATNLSKTFGDTVSVDCVDIIGGKPIPGDQNAEGRGTALSFSSMDVKINLLTKVVDAGGRMTQQRTRHDLKMLAKDNIVGYMKRLETAQCLVHLAGARGEQVGSSWPVPLESDADFADIMINPVKRPTYNRHFTVNAGAITELSKGGDGISALISTCTLKLEHIDWLRAYIDGLEFRPQPIRVADDPAAEDEPLYVLLVPAFSYRHLLTNTSGAVLRTFQQNAWNRANWGSKHPLFKGEVGIWNNILVKKIDYAIQWDANGTSTTTTNLSTDTAGQESNTETMPTISGYVVERLMLLGAQALANCYGRNQSSDYYYGWLERRYNFDRATEIAVDVMGGKAKLRFSPADSTGTPVLTDHGVMCIDVAAQKIA
jgi:N4-gp56 family major capsid protein